MKRVESTTTVDVDRMVDIETTPNGELMATFQRMPVKFETIYDDKMKSFTIKASWRA